MCRTQGLFHIYTSVDNVNGSFQVEMGPNRIGFPLDSNPYNYVHKNEKTAILDGWMDGWMDQFFDITMNHVEVF